MGSDVAGFFVAGVCVADDSHGGVVGEAEAQALLGFFAPVSDRDESGVFKQTYSVFQLWSSTHFLTTASSRTILTRDL